MTNERLKDFKEIAKNSIDDMIERAYNLGYQVALTKSSNSLGNLSNEIIKLLKAQNKILTLSEIKACFDNYTNQNIETTLSRLVAKGLINRVGLGKYKFNK